MVSCLKARKVVNHLYTERIQLLFSKYVLVFISECLDKKYKNDYCLSKTRSTIIQKCRNAKEVEDNTRRLKIIIKIRYVELLTLLITARIHKKVSV